MPQMAAVYFTCLRYDLLLWVESWYTSDWWHGWLLTRFINTAHWLTGCHRGRGCTRTGTSGPPG